MRAPQICYSKLFWTLVFAGLAASFTFTQLLFSITDEKINTVKADSVQDLTKVEQNTIKNGERMDKIITEIQQTNKKLDVLVCETTKRCD